MSAGASLLALPLMAQSGRDPKREADTTKTAGMSGMSGMMSMMRDCPMMAAMTHGPAAALARRKALRLTADQVQRLEVARERAQVGERPAMDSMSLLHDRFKTLVEAEEFSEATVRALFERMGVLNAEMGVSMLRARHDTRVILSAEQRQQLDAGAKGMMGMSGAGCPMMPEPSHWSGATPPNDHHGSMMVAKPAKQP